MKNVFLEEEIKIFSKIGKVQSQIMSFNSFNSFHFCFDNLLKTKW